MQQRFRPVKRQRNARRSQSVCRCLGTSCEGHAVEGGSRLRALRVEAGLTIDGLAERSGVSPRTIGGIERGRIRCPHQRTIGALADGLGLGPGGGDRLRAAEDAAPAAAGLPRVAPGFTGREEDLAWLVAAAGRGPLVHLAGLPGIGKTALAIQAAARLAGDFPDGVRFVALGGDPPPMVARRVAQALGGDAGADCRGLLARRRVLLILDGVGEPGQVAPLLGAEGPAVTVLTSSRRLPLPGGQCRVLAPLSAAAGERALHRMIDGVVPAPLAGVLARHCHGLPLALRAVANRVLTRRRWPVERIAERLARPGRSLDELSAGDLSVGAAFHRGYRQLPGPARSAVRALAQGSAAPAVLSALADCGWAWVRPSGEYEIHPVLRGFAATL
ncbi:helix-turn-helix domain-containing protein [Amycolatopsis sp. NPDC026612]|uniref:helix-turn-helix domain-containing protein n=1 Tax=Amycolatopsis sp. NPDC026612 TaxID=3155466 RepID=UPI0033F1F28B